jgi:hypothetical protein
LLTLVFVTALPSAPASAQEVSVGYQFQHLSGGGDGLNAPMGIAADLAIPLLSDLDAVGQVDWSRKSESETIFGTSVKASINIAAFGGGIRWSTRASQRLTPFVQALFGAMHVSGSASVAGRKVADDSGTKALLQVGGGVAVPIAGVLSALGQFDYRRVFTEHRGLDSIRVVGGIRVVLRRP